MTFFMYSLSNNIYITSLEKAFCIDFLDLVAIVNDTISQNFINVQNSVDMYYYVFSYRFYMGKPWRL